MSASRQPGTWNQTPEKAGPPRGSTYNYPSGQSGGQNYDMSGWQNNPNSSVMNSSRQDFEKTHTYGSSRKVVLQYSTNELEELERETQQTRDRLKDSHHKLNQAREEIKRERAANEDLKQRSRTSSPIRTPTKPEVPPINAGRNYEIEQENRQLTSQRNELEREFSIRKQEADKAEVQDGNSETQLKMKERRLMESLQQKAALQSRKAEEEHLQRMIVIYMDENQKLLATMRTNNGRVNEAELEYLRRNSQTIKEQVEAILNDRKNQQAKYDELMRTYERTAQENRTLTAQLSNRPAVQTLPPTNPQPQLDEATVQRRIDEEVKRAIRELQIELESMRDIATQPPAQPVELTARLRMTDTQKQTLERRLLDLDNNHKRLSREIQQLQDGLRDPARNEAQKRYDQDQLFKKQSEERILLNQIRDSERELNKLGGVENQIRKLIKQSEIASSMQPQPTVDPEAVRQRDLEISQLRQDLRRTNDELRVASEKNSILERNQSVMASNRPQGEELARLQSELQRISTQRDDAVRENQRITAEYKMVKMNLDDSKDELQKTQVKMRNLQSENEYLHTTTKKPVVQDSPVKKTFVGQTSKEELDMLDRRLQEFDDCNRQLSEAINNLQKSMVSQPQYTASQVHTSTMQTSRNEASDLLVQLVRELDHKIKRMEGLSQKQENQFASMLQDISVQPKGITSTGSNRVQETTITSLDPALIKLIVAMQSTLEREEIESLKAIKQELQHKVNAITAENMNLETQVKNLIAEINKSKKFFEQLTEEINKMRDNEQRLRRDLGESNRKLSSEEAARRDLESQNRLKAQELERVAQDQENYRQEMQAMRRKVEEYSARKRAQAQAGF